MLKARHSTYQPGRRGLAWLKLKRELATLDVVVTAAEYGHGNAPAGSATTPSLSATATRCAMWARPTPA